MKICKKCKKQIPVSVNQCPHCGEMHPLMNVVFEKSDQNILDIKTGSVLNKESENKSIYTNVKLNDAENFLFVGNEFFIAGKYQLAIKSFNEVIGCNPAKQLLVMAWHNKGLAYTGMENLEEAVICFDRAIEINDEFESAWNYKGVALSDLERDAEAIESYDQALKINKNNGHCWSNKGDSLFNLGKYQEAIACYYNALEIHPDNVSAWLYKGLALSHLNNHEWAIECYNRAITIDPEFELIWRYKGLAFSSLGNHKEALKCFDNALKINPQDKIALEYKLIQICSRFDEFCYCDEIPKSKLKNATKHYSIPKEESVFLLCDATKSGDCRLGFAIGTTGVFWGDDQTTEKQNKTLTWAEFCKRDFELVKGKISLGCGDVIDVTALRNRKDQDKVLALFIELKKNLKKGQ